tara:strand:- start:122 stop:265 length:144 start_codon:yes stop_codon:yes gene_type:complete
MVLVHPIVLEDNPIEGKSCWLGLTAMSQRFLPQKNKRQEGQFTIDQF